MPLQLPKAVGGYHYNKRATIKHFFNRTIANTQPNMTAHTMANRKFGRQTLFYKDTTHTLLQTFRQYSLANMGQNHHSNRNGQDNGFQEKEAIAREQAVQSITAKPHRKWANYVFVAMIAALGGYVVSELKKKIKEFMATDNPAYMMLKEADKLAKQGLYNEALVYYDKALAINNLNGNAYLQ